MSGHPCAAMPLRGGAAVGVSSSFGTFGELLQGVLPGGVDFLVTLPIARWTTATFTADPTTRELRVDPPHKWKARVLARQVLENLGYAGGGRLVLDGSLPEGKGLASSSADLVATARAVTNALGADITAPDIEDLLRPIEPTDGVMYPGVVAYHHREVRLRETLGSLPPLTVVALDEGGQVDTMAFNRRTKPFDQKDQIGYGDLLMSLGTAVRDGDMTTVGAVATRSAVLNQRLRPKRTLARLVEECHRSGGLGVVTAHSGTMSGVLLADDDPFYRQKLAAARWACLSLAGNVTVHRTLAFDHTAIADGTYLGQST